MTRDEWLAKTLADRPPLTPAQVAQLRHVLAPVAAQISAAPAADKAGTAPDTETLTTTEPERTRNA